jgi:hypothetical protein
MKLSSSLCAAAALTLSVAPSVNGLYLCLMSKTITVPGYGGKGGGGTGGQENSICVAGQGPDSASCWDNAIKHGVLAGGETCAKTITQHTNQVRLLASFYVPSFSSSL